MRLNEENILEYRFELMEFQATMEGMIAENRLREIQGFSPAYGDEQFEAFRKKIQERHDNLVMLLER